MATQTEIARLLIRLQADTAELRRGLSGASGQIQAFASQAKTMLGAIGIGFGLTRLAESIKQAVAAAHEYNSQMEQAKLGIASLITATSEITDQTGRRLEGEEKLQAALKISSDLYRQIQTYAAQTAATAPEIVDGFQSMIGPGRAAGLEMEQILRLSVLLTQAMTAMNLPMVQMRVEANALLKAEENVRADVMKNLGIRAEELKLAKEQGRLYEVLEQKLSAFAVASQHQMDTWKGLRTTLSDILGLLGGMAEKPLFDAAREAVKSLSGYLTESQDGVLGLSDAAQSAASQIGATFSVIAGHFRAFREEYGAILWLIAKALQAVNISIASGITGITALLTAVHAAGTAVLVVLNNITLGAIPPLASATKAAIEEQKRLIKSLADQAAETAKTFGGLQGVFGMVDEKGRVKILVGDVEKLAQASEEVKRKSQKNKLDAKDIVDPEAAAKAKDAIEKISEKTAELAAQQASLVNPVEGSRIALEAWINEATKGAAKTPELEEAIKKLRAQFESLEAAKEAKRKLEILDKAAIARTAEEVEAGLKEIQAKYEEGLVGIDEYFARRKDLIEAGARAEIEVLRTQLGRAGTESERLEIQQEILGREAEARAKLADITREQAKAARELAAAARESATTDEVERLRTELERVNARYQEGLVTIQEYYAVKRATAEGVSRAEIAALEEQLAAGVSQTEQVRIQTEIVQKRAELERELIALSQEEAEALRQQSMEALSLQSTLLAARERAALGTGVIGEMRAQFAAQMAQMDETHAREIAAFESMKEQQILIEGRYYTKAEALAALNEAHQKERAQRIKDFEQQVLEARLSMTQQVFGSMASAFDQLYTQTGKKHKQFFYVAKAAAIAEAIVNTALAVTKAWAQGGPIFGPALAALAATAGAIQIGIIMGQAIAGPGAKEGGLIDRGGRWDRDDVPVRLSRHEFVIPRRSVEYYGVQVLEAMRRRAVPRAVLASYAISPVHRPLGAYQAGGEVLYGELGGTRTGTPGNVTINVHNEGTPQRVTKTETRQTESEQIFDIWLDNISRDFRKRSQVKDLLR